MRRLRLLCPLLLLLATSLHADPPEGYYTGADDLTGEALRIALHEIIDDHMRLPYTSFETDTWDVIHEADEHPEFSDSILDVYRNRRFLENDHWSSSNTTGWNREHSWPKSYGFAEDGNCNYPFTDVHHLFASDPDYNEARGNIPYDWAPDGSFAYPVDGTGFANWKHGQYEDGSWEVWPLRRGDLARAMFYMEVRYEGGAHGISGCAEPDLRLTDERDDFVWSSRNLDVAYMGMLSTLVEWHLEDPVDERERRRNEIVFAAQENRNPFVDHPEWVCAIWICPVLVDLSGYPHRNGEVWTAELEWSGLAGPAVDIYRDGTIVDTTPNDGSWSDQSGITTGSRYLYRVCEPESTTCSEEIAITFSSRRRPVRGR